MSPRSAPYLGKPPHGASLPLPVIGAPRPHRPGDRPDAEPAIRLPVDILDAIRAGEAPATDQIARRIGLPDDTATIARLTTHLRDAGFLGVEITTGKPARTQLLWVPRAWLREREA